MHSGGHFPLTHLTVAEGSAFGPSANASDERAGRIRLSADRAQKAVPLSAALCVRILFVALSNDIGSERIITRMSQCGIECAVMSPANYFCASISSAKRHFSLPDHGGIWLGAIFCHRRLLDAMREWQPRLILPLDDIAAWLLRSLAITPTVIPALRSVLVESLGAPHGYCASVSRHAFMHSAAQLGVRKPAHCEYINAGAALAAAEAWGYPIVIKREHTCGGKGVVIAHDASELVAQLQSLPAAVWPRRLRQLAKQFLLYVAGFRIGPAAGAVLQSFVPGVPAFRTLAAWNGRVLDGVSFVAEQTHPGATGASTVVRQIENDEIDRAAAIMTAALGCSGFVSFDFMLDPDTGHAVLIEMNPRSITSSHLGGLFGHDICGALAGHLMGTPLPPVKPGLTPAAVALFPKELERDAESAYLKSPDVVHDVPRDDPALMVAYLQWLKAAYSGRVKEAAGSSAEDIGCEAPRHIARGRPDAEKFAAPVRSNRPSIS
jgi:Carbamoyl-phosphate synthase L chain, ATP binding domain